MWLNFGNLKFFWGSPGAVGDQRDKVSSTAEDDEIEQEENDDEDAKYH